MTNKMIIKEDNILIGVFSNYNYIEGKHAFLYDTEQPNILHEFEIICCEKDNKTTIKHIKLHMKKDA